MHSKAMFFIFLMLWVNSIRADTTITWRELIGENDWEGLLDPLNIDLRKYLINYGERASAAEYAFNDKEKCNCRGFPRYPPEEFFSKLGIEERSPYKYNVDDFIFSAVDFAKETDSEINIFLQTCTWFGYVAVATDEAAALLGRRDIVFAWRGTHLLQEWVKDVEALLVQAPTLFGVDNDAKVHYGFLSLYNSTYLLSPYTWRSARDQALEKVRELVDYYYSKNEDVSIIVTGHSLGAAVATLNAVDIAYNGYNKPTTNSSKSFPVTGFVYGGPRVGDNGFKSVYDSLSDLHILRITNKKDLVPKLPLIIPPYFNYADVGKNLTFDTTLSPYLKYGVYAHSIDAYLHGVAGTQGSKGGWNLSVDLDTALINRGMDGLVDEYNTANIPANWWTTLNKDLVQKDGKYVITSDFYVPPIHIAWLPS